MNTTLFMPVLVVLALGAAQATLHAQASAVIRSGARLLDETLEIASKLSGRTLSPAARKAALETLERAALRHGDEVLAATRRGGLELLEAAAKHGDIIWELAGKVPSATRVLAVRADELLPLVRRLGPEVLELEAKVPSAAARVATQFGDDAVVLFARSIPERDIPRLIGYAERADSPATRQLLLSSYQQTGGKILDWLDWKKIMAVGLSSAMITAAYKTSDGIQEGLKTTALQHPETFAKTTTEIVRRVTIPFVWPATALGLGWVLIRLRRWGLFRRPSPAATPPPQNHNAPPQPSEREFHRECNTNS